MTDLMIAVEALMDPIAAPVRLTTDNRQAFRVSALDGLERAVRDGVRTVDVDLAATLEMDASGLGVLVLLQKRARERGLGTRLLHVPRPVRQMLDVTRLAGLFEEGSTG